MDELKRKFEVESTKEERVRALRSRLLDFKSKDSLQKIVELSWPKYLLGAFFVAVAALSLNFPLVKHLHWNSDLNDEKNRIMKRFYDELDREEFRFQQNLLKKFRKDKNTEAMNVTDDDLNKSSFFN